MKILFVAAEGAPFAKTGGLGDVIGALPKSLVKNGHEVAVILPYYDVVSAKFGDQVEDLGFFYTNVGWRRQYVGIKKIVRDGVTSSSLIMSSISTVERYTVSGMMVSVLVSSKWLPLS